MSNQHRTASSCAALDQPGEHAVHRADRVDPARNGNGDDAAYLRAFCESNDPAAFAVLMTRHIGWVSRLVRRHVKDRHLAEDVTQAVFIILARKAHTIRANGSLSAWLFRVARFTANDAIKHETRRRKRMQRVAESLPGTNGDSHDDSRGSDLDDAIACLSESDRQILVLRFYEDMSIAQIGVVLGIQEDATKKRVSRALQRLRKLLAGRGIRVASIAALVAMLDQTTVEAALVHTPIVHTSITSTRANELARSSTRAFGSVQMKLMAALGTSAIVALLMLVASFLSSTNPVRSPLAVSQSSLNQSTINRSSISSNAPSSPVSEIEQMGSIERLWVGQSNSWAWPVPIRPQLQAPISLRSLSGAEYSVALIQDDRDQWWYHEIDTSQIGFTDSPVTNFESNGPPTGSNTKIDILDIFDLHAPGYFAPVSRKWRRATFSPANGDVSLQLEIDEGPTLGVDSGAGIVPEPGMAIVSLLCVGCCLLKRRRGDR